MATKDVYFSGKCTYAKLVHPDDMYNKWQLNLYFNDKSLEDFRALKLKTHLKKDDDGYFAKISCPVQKLIKGVMKPFQAPKVFDKEGKPMEGILIGNGSDVTVKCELYQYSPPGSKERANAIRLTSVRVDSLVPYEPKRDFTPEQAKAAEGLTDQPEPVF